MIITRRVKLGNNNYYIKCDCVYKKKNNTTQLCLKNYSNDYYDGGDLSLLIEEIENKYTKKTYQKYGDSSWLMTDCLYIYDNIPFISGVGDYYTDADNSITSAGYLTTEELDQYIKENNIKMKDSSGFKLCNGYTWKVGE